MNDDNLIDNALKEHARHEGNDDQEFLNQLDAKLDGQVEETLVQERRSEPRSSKRGAWMSAAALVMVSVTAGALYQMKGGGADEFSEPSPLVSYHAAPEAVPELAPVVVTQVERKPAAPSSSTAKVISASTTSPTYIPVPEYFGRNTGMVVPTSRDQGFGLVIGDGDGWAGGTFGQVPSDHSSGNKYGMLIEQGFLSPLKAPLSTFSVDVDTASYTNIRKHVQSSRVIDANAVRIEEMINYFDYQYAEPTGDHPFAVQTEVSDCPWNAKNRLVKIGLKGRDLKDGRKAANLVFLIDVSGSMSSADKLPLLVKSFEILLKSLNEEDRVSLVVYAGRQAVLLRPTAVDGAGRAAVSQALQKLSAGGSTNGSAGISTAYDLARSGFIKRGVNRVVLATDGDFNVGTTNQAELLELVKHQAEGKISLTILGFGQGNLNDKLMEELTNKGDGNYFYLDSLREGQRVFQQKLTGTIETIAKDVKIQVEFNPGKVAQYRLIGYANRRLKDEDFANDKIDAGDIGGGHTVTALYEVVPAGADTNQIPGDLKYQKNEEVTPPRQIVDSPELLTVKLRYKMPDGDISTELSQALTDDGKGLANASDDFRFASSVALWGLLLSDSEYAANGTIEMIEKLALDGLGQDQQGERAEFLDLVSKWQERL